MADPTAGFSIPIPRGLCPDWPPTLVWVHAASDLATALAYVVMSLALIAFMRRRGDPTVSWTFAAFVGLILAGAAAQILLAVTLWQPLYWLDGGLKAVTAAFSIAAAVLLWPLLRRALQADRGERATERQTAMDNLRRSEARQRVVYARTPAALHTLDLDARLIAVNDRWTELLGYERHEVLGRPLADFLVPDTLGRFQAGWAHLMGGGALQDVERRMVCKDGASLDVLVSAIVERDAAGEPIQVMSAVTDVTQRRATEAALRASEERLRQAQKMQAVGQLTSGIAHDFNNMLTVITANLELLQEWVPGEARLARLIDSAFAGAQRAALLTSQLLSFSRQQRLEPQALDLAAVVEGVRDLLVRTLGESGRLLLGGLAGSAWRCLADRNQLESALLNLVLNARAALTEGGEVRIVVADRTFVAEDLAAAELQDDEAPLPGDYVVLSVIDTGQGMTEAVRRRVLEPFFTTRPNGQGSGLGLSQIYGFVRQSGGALRIESAPGEGTRVDLLLPRAPDAVPAESRPTVPRKAAESARMPGGPVLVVEDEEGLREVVMEALRERGWRVLAASDAAGGLACLDAHPEIAMLFTDVAMPGRLDGVDLALEARRRRPDIPVLFATGYADLSVMSRWPDRPEVLQKPYSVARLAQRLRGILELGLVA